MKWLLAFPISTVLLAQTMIPNGAPASHVFDGRIDEWRALPPTFVLRSTTGGRKAKVWVRQDREGLLIAGEVLGGAPDFPGKESEMLQKDHVEVWLAPEHAPVFPKVGWGNMFGPVIVNKRQDCIDYGNTHMHDFVTSYAENCDAWLAAVAEHRPRVARLFVRQFLLSPGLTVEGYAQPAWEKIVKGYTDTGWESMKPNAWPIIPPPNDPYPKYTRPLNPDELPSFKAVPFEGGYGFESLVPWESMPPLTSLDLKSLRLMVDVFSAHTGTPKNQPFSTSSPTRRYGVSSTMNLVQFAAGRKFHVTACEYPLQEMDLPANVPGPAFFRATAADEVMATMILVNEYGYHSFTPEGESPEVVTLHHWQQPLAGITTSTACGSQLAVRDAAGIHRLTTEGDKDTVAGLAQPDGAYLLKSGPTVNQDFDDSALDPCMECKVVDLHIWLVTPHSQPKQMLELHEKAGIQSLMLDRDIQLSADWSKVTIYRETSREPSEWESETLCRQGFEYKSCAKVAHSSPPPLPRVVEPVPQ
jgi:hypothetical protein